MLFLHLCITCYPLLSNQAIICLLHTPSVTCLPVSNYMEHYPSLSLTQLVHVVLQFQISISQNSWNLFPHGSYRISRPIRSTFFPEKCDLNSTCVLCTKGKYYFQTYKYPYLHRVKAAMKMILVDVMMIFWVSMMNKLYYGC